MFESSTTFIKATQIKRDESDSQNLTKVLYHQKLLQIFLFSLFFLKHKVIKTYDFLSSL